MTLGRNFRLAGLLAATVGAFNMARGADNSFAGKVAPESTASYSTASTAAPKLPASTRAANFSKNPNSVGISIHMQPRHSEDEAVIQTGLAKVFKANGIDPDNLGVAIQYMDPEEGDKVILRAFTHGTQFGVRTDDPANPVKEVFNLKSFVIEIPTIARLAKLDVPATSASVARPENGASLQQVAFVARDHD